jgi:hypothetical protein
MSLSIHSLYQQIFRIWRARRISLFKAKLSPRRSDKLLDVGGYPGSWTPHPPLVGSIDSLNIHLVPWDENLAPNHNIAVLVGDGCNLDMQDRSYDIVFSNSVIEHVGSWERQKAFANEVRRVGNALWIQTPAFECPLEPHFLTPFIHWFPPSFQRAMARYFTVWGLMTRPTPDQVATMVADIRLLKLKEMKTLFPDCEIYIEMLLPLVPKSYVAYRKRREL